MIQVFNFIFSTLIGPMYIAKISACIIIESQTPHLAYWIR